MLIRGWQSGLWVRPCTEDEAGGGDPGKRRITEDTRCLSRTASYEHTGKMGQDGPLYLTSHKDCI